jgi:hypothetical protein
MKFVRLVSQEHRPARVLNFMCGTVFCSGQSVCASFSSASIDRAEYFPPVIFAHFSLAFPFLKGTNRFLDRCRSAREVVAFLVVLEIVEKLDLNPCADVTFPDCFHRISLSFCVQALREHRPTRNLENRVWDGVSQSFSNPLAITTR